MKIIVILLAFAFVSFNVSAQSFSLQIHSAISNDKSIAFLAYSGLTDSAFYENSKSLFKGELVKPTIGDLVIDYGFDDKLHYLFMLSAGEIIVDLLKNQQGDSIVVSGSKIATDFEYKLLALVIFFNNENHKYQDLIRTANSRGHDTTTFVVLRNKAIYNCFQVPRQFVKSNPGSPLCIAALKMLGKGSPIAEVNTNDLKFLYALLSSEVKESEEGQQYGKWLETLENTNK